MWIHNLQTSVFHNIIHIPVQNAVCLQSLKNQVIKLLILCEIRNPEKLLRMLLPQRSENCCFLPFQYDKRAFVSESSFFDLFCGSSVI